MDQGLPLDDNETEDFVKIEHYLLMSQHTQLKDLQTAHRLIGKKNLKPIHLFIRYTWNNTTIIGTFLKLSYPMSVYRYTVTDYSPSASMNRFLPKFCAEKIPAASLYLAAVVL